MSPCGSADQPPFRVRTLCLSQAVTAGSFVDHVDVAVSAENIRLVLLYGTHIKEAFLVGTSTWPEI